MFPIQELIEAEEKLDFQIQFSVDISRFIFYATADTVWFYFITNL